MLLKIGQYINKHLIQRFTDQGHHLTGVWENSLTLEVSGDTLTCKANHYSKWLDKGVPATDIKYPYAPARIEALTEYAKLRGMAGNEKQAISIAYAIATKHKAEGMPTRASSKYSKTGKRTEFVTDILNEQSAIVKDMIQRHYLSTLQTTVNNQIRKLAV